MRRTLWIAVLAVLPLAAPACGEKAQPIRLPAAQEVERVRLSCGTQSAVRQDPDWIGTFLESAAQARPTAKTSIQDAPDCEGAVQIGLVLKEGSGSTLFAYPLRGNWHLGQPYQVIYETEERLWKSLGEPGG